VPLVSGGEESTMTDSSNVATFSPVGLCPSGTQALINMYKTEDEHRELLIKRSRDVLKYAKSSVYSIHRGDLVRSAQDLDKALEIIKAELLPATVKYPALRQLGMVCGALEEWAEAKIFLAFKKENRIPSIDELSITSTDEYLGGLLDFTGELNRYAVLRATHRDSSEVARCADLIDKLMELFLQFDFRNSNLRRKYDTLKYTQKKIESLTYELSLARAMGNIVPQSLQMGDEPPVTATDAAEPEWH